jgi:osmotically-inducible protein OsmY
MKDPMIKTAHPVAALALAAFLAACQNPAVQETPQDAAISARVHSALAAVNIGRAYSRPLRIETVNGHVDLHGFVRDDAEVYKAGVVAARVPGVIGVENHLQMLPMQGNPDFPVFPSMRR